MKHKHRTNRSHRRTRRSPKPVGPLQVIHPDAAGIDVGARQLWVAVPADRDESPVRVFGSMTPDLLELVDWLLACGVTTVAMEATGVYWIPVYDLLEERGIEVVLVNPRYVKHVPGRKSDVLDCQWLQQLHTFGCCGAAFAPQRRS